MEGRKIKEKQKREMRKIEDNKDLLITFSKRKSGIHKKATELSTLCGAKVDILMCTSSGNWFSYGEPSHQAMERSRDEENPAKDGDNQLVEDHTKSEIDELIERNYALMKQMCTEKEREKELDEEILKTGNTCRWWEANIQDLSYEKAKEMEASFVELKKKLENALSIEQKEKENDFYVNGVNSCLTYTSGSSISEVVFGANNEACGIGASESILPDISLSATNEEQEFKFFPYGERREDLFDIVYPPKNQARREDRFFVDDPNGSGKSAFTSFPTKQTQGLNFSDAKGSSSHTPVFSSLNQSQGDNQLLHNANNETVCRRGNENTGGNGSDDLFASSPLNQHQEANPFIYIENVENDDFSFPPLNGHDQGYF